MKYAKGIMWLDDCRIPFVDEDKDKINFDRPRVRASVNEDWVLKQAHDYTDPSHKEYNQQGRFTPNLLVCDDMLNDGSVSKSNQKKKTIEKKHNYNVNFGIGENYNEINDKGSSSRYYDLDTWFNKVIDEIR